ncbi:MAG: hypothetical protein K2K49_02790 [Duncaniella sp.]|nr:hypothetical protein [Duncaniella sp.]
MTASGRIGRWWRSKGHGIHSPLAFRLTTTVLRDPGCAWYAYGRLAGARERLLFRVACEFDPRTVIVPEGVTLTAAEREAFEAARSTVRFATEADAGEEPFIFTDGDHIPSPLPARAIIYIGGGARLPLLGRADRGICLTDGDRALMVMRPDLTPQTFEINFR